MKKCLFCGRRKLTTFGVCVPEHPTFFLQGKQATFVFGLCRHHEEEIGSDSVQDRAVEIVGDSLSYGQRRT